MSEAAFTSISGITVDVEGDAVVFRASGTRGRMVLGAPERIIRFQDVKAREWKPATRLVNGWLDVAAWNGKSRVVVRFKDNPAAEKLFTLIEVSTPHASASTREIGVTQKNGMEGPASLKAAVGEIRELRSYLADAAAEATAETVAENAGLTYTTVAITYRGVTQPLAGTTATVDTAGALTKRSTVGRIAAGALIAGPAGGLAGALAQKKTDNRELYLLIDGPEASWAVPLQPDDHPAAQRLAAFINTAAKAAAADAEPEQAEEAAVSVGGTPVAEQLATLTALHEQGVLSDDEFAAAKTRTLDL